jgi:hypothetical protein
MAYLSPWSDRLPYCVGVSYAWFVKLLLAAAGQRLAIPLNLVQRCGNQWSVATNSALSCRIAINTSFPRSSTKLNPSEESGRFR